MCISTAYQESENGAVLAEYVASVKQSGGSVFLTDIMGGETEIPGVLALADLTRGVLVIETSATNTKRAETVHR